MPPPNVDDPLAHAVYRECRHSVVFVELRPDAQQVYDRWTALYPYPNNLTVAKRVEEEDERLRLSGETVIGTGSWLQSTPEADYVLTCAHLVHPVFNQQNPITLAEFNDLYHAHVLCEHRERTFLGGQDEQRDFAPGLVYRVSFENDLLVIRIPRARMNHYCTGNHRLLTFARRVPKTLKKAIMISWPDYWRDMTTALGRVSKRRRLIARMGRNPFGFTTSLTEVDITSEAGSSGGPLFNGESDLAGILHGGNTKFSYYIGLHEIKNTLTAWGETHMQTFLYQLLPVL